MTCHPGADNGSGDEPDEAVDEQWSRVLAHRAAPERGDVVARFRGAGLSADSVLEALVDGGDALYAAASDRRDGWADRFGGLLGAALLAAEVSALAAHLVSRAASVRATAVDGLLEDYSAITVAAGIGVSRQKVYDVARASERPGDYIDDVPWRRHERDA